MEEYKDHAKGAFEDNSQRLKKVETCALAHQDGAGSSVRECNLRSLFLWMMRPFYNFRACLSLKLVSFHFAFWCCPNG